MGSVTVDSYPHGKSPKVAGDLKIMYLKIAMSNSYATNGDTFNFATEAGIPNIISATIEDGVYEGTDGNVILSPDLANNKIKAHEAGTASAGFDEVDSADDLSGDTAILKITGY